MNVLLASVDALPRMGGVSVMTHHVAAALVRNGARVVFVGPEGSYVPQGFDRNYHFYEDVASDVVQRGGEGSLTEDARITALFEVMIARYSIDRVVLMHPFYYGIGAIEACRRAGVPCTVFFHGLEICCQIVQSNGPVDLAKIRRASNLTALRDRTFACIARADELAVNSFYTADILYGFDRGLPVRVVGCGVDIESVERQLSDLAPGRTGKSSRRRALGLPDRPTIAFVGRLVANKRADRLASLLRHLPDMQALIVGDGPDRDRIVLAAANAGTSDRLIMAGRVDEERKWSLLGASDFLCLLSEADDRYGAVEGFGIALLEGAAAGAILVTSGQGGMRDVVADGVNGIVLDAEDEALARRIGAVWSNEPAAAKLVAAAKDQIVNRFNWDVIALSLLSSWREVNLERREVMAPSAFG